MTSTLWQSYHLAKEPFKKTLEKVGVCLVGFFWWGVGARKGGDMLTTFSLSNK